MTPFIVKDKIKCKSVPVPCGKCPNCIKRRVSGWSFRLMQESKRAISGHFITLTYGNLNAKTSKKGFMELSKLDLQLFFKRLRKAHEHTNRVIGLEGLADVSGRVHVPIKYYAVGEYGGKTERPHYHIILFNARVELIQPAWDLGHVHYGEITGASVGYTLKYIAKEKRVPMHKNDDRQPEFALMSKGLGDNYLDGKCVKWHHADLENRMYLALEDGRRIAMPRYYKEKIYVDSERMVINQFVLKNVGEEEAKKIKELGGIEKLWQEQVSRVRAAFKKQNFNSKKRDNL